MPAPDVRAMLVHVVKAANRHRRASLSSSGRAQIVGRRNLRCDLKRKWVGYPTICVISLLRMARLVFVMAWVHFGLVEMEWAGVLSLSTP